MAEIIGQSSMGSAKAIASVNNQNMLFVSQGLPSYPAVGGSYSVAGQTTAVIAASLAANTTLMSMRFPTPSSLKAYIDKIRVLIVPSTLGAAGSVMGTLGLQRFSAATPSGGTSRLANICKLDQDLADNSVMLDIRDNNADLTTTSVVFGGVVSTTLVPVFITSGPSCFEWIFEPPQPLVLGAGEGVALETQVAMPATQTWMYSYTVWWSEH